MKSLGFVRFKVVRVGLAVAWIASLGLASGADAMAKAPRESGLAGTVTKGPMCPGPKRPDRPCPDKPVAARFRVLDAGGKVVATFTSDEEGHFRVLLAPGTYTILPEGERDGANPLKDSARVCVTAGVVSEVRLYWDTGMR